MNGQIGSIARRSFTNFPAGPVAMLAVENNLALRRIALDDELLTALARIHGEARRRIVRLLEDLKDAEQV